MQQSEKIKINWNPNDEEIEVFRIKYNSLGLVYYTPLEEILNTLTHGAGILVGILSLIIILSRATTIFHIATAVTMCAGFIILFASSATYHAVTNTKIKQKVRKIDHASVILVVISSGAPIIFATPPRMINYILLALCLAIAAANYLGCLFMFDKFKKIAFVNNFIAGVFLAIAFFISKQFIPFGARMCYLASLLFCISGVLFYGKKKKYTHTVFHALTFISSSCCIAAALLMV